MGVELDSFLLSFAEGIMGKRPLLMLELDEHGADAGYGIGPFDVAAPCQKAEAFSKVNAGGAGADVAGGPG